MDPAVLLSALRPMSDAFKSATSIRSTNAPGKAAAARRGRTPVREPMEAAAGNHRSPSTPPTPRKPTVLVAGADVPADLYMDLLKAGEKARKRGQHRQVIVQDEGSNSPPQRHLILAKPKKSSTQLHL
mmetsp:Transcript_43535/g.102610  ORF Transcript_43535/g.102610 Transcript_43535/m.102610 type:complete len:128 (+) Transcript_43535:106-489(+)